MTTITTNNGSTIEFLGLDEPAEIRGHSTMSGPVLVDRDGNATPIDMSPGARWETPNEGDYIEWRTIHLIDGEVVS